MSEPVIPKRCPCCRADLEHGVVVGMHIQGCELGAAEAKVAELEKIIAEPWEHTDHWRNPETGYVECECCCKWALDAERDHKAIAEQAATIAKEESRSNELAKEVAILRVDLRGLAATLERLTGYLDYMAMGFVPPDRCKSYAAAALKNPSEPK